MPTSTPAIGADIGGTHISAMTVDAKTGRSFPETHCRISYAHTDTADQILGSWASAIAQTLDRTTGAPAAGVGLAMPGPFDYRNGISNMQHKFGALYGLNIADALRERLPALQNMPIRFINDATAFAMGEAWKGAGRGHSRVVVITLGTGFGSAFLENGVPVVRAPGVPPEGCLWHTPFRGEIAEEHFSTRWFVKAYRERTGMTVDGVKPLMEKAGQDPVVQGLFTEFGHNLARCLSPWLQSFDADILVIGGNISHAFPLFGTVFQQDLTAANVRTAVAVSALREEAAILGSARLLDDAVWEKVSADLPAI